MRLQKQILTSLAVILAATLAACTTNASVSPMAAPTQPPASPTGAAGAPEIARPSNAGGPGPALSLSGNATAGAAIFAANCTPCHSALGHGGVANVGSDDGTVPALNPIDETLKDKDLKVFAYNLDLFIQHGSTPAGANPTLKMPAWGDQKKLADQQIADVIAYVISLNQP